MILWMISSKGYFPVSGSDGRLLSRKSRMTRRCATYCARDDFPQFIRAFEEIVDFRFVFLGLESGLRVFIHQGMALILQFPLFLVHLLVQKRFKGEAPGARRNPVDEFLHVTGEGAVLGTFRGDVIVDGGPFLRVDFLQERLQIGGNTVEGGTADAIESDVVEHLVGRARA